MDMSIQIKSYQRWSDDMDVRLRDLWATDKSASEIAIELGCGLTRNAVIGRANRLGLARRSTANKPRPRRVPSPHGNATRKPQYKKDRRKVKMNPRGGQYEVVTEYTPVQSVDDLNIPLEQRKQLLDLTPETCRWPVGDPCSKDFFFCGGETFMDFPYCSAHCRIAYQPPAARKTTKDRGRDWNIGTFKKAAA